jgi:hypothetical protein
MRAMIGGLAASLLMACGAMAGCPEADDLRNLVARTGPGTDKAALAILWTEFDPIAILPTRAAGSPVVFRAQAQGAPDSLRLEYSGGGTLALLDNGVAPDTVAGDQVYSANLPTPEILSRNVGNRTGRPILGFLKPVVGGVVQSLAVNIIGEVAPADMPAYPVATIAGAPFDYRTTSHVVNYVDAAFHADRIIENSVKRILPRIGDHHDFVDVLSVQRRYVENRFHGGVRNNVAGIGLAMFDNGASFGSPARLKGYGMYPTLSFYDPQNSGYTHELGHQWINFLAGTLDDTVNAHWPVGPLAHDVMGTSGGGGQGINTSCLLVRQAGVVTATPQPNSPLFNPYELYLMGLLPGAQLAPTWTFTDQAAARNLIVQPNWCSGTINLATTDVSLATITGANGARVPAQGQRYFTTAQLAVSVNRLLDDTEMRYLTWLALRGDNDQSLPAPSGLVVETGMTFWAATGGRARIDMRLAAVFRDTFD